MENIKYNLSKRQLIYGYLFLLPNLAGFIILTFIPVIVSLVLSFTDWDGFSIPNFIGIKNYINMFKDETFRISFGNNIYYTVGSVPATIILGLVLAILMNNKVKYIGIFRTIYFMPYITAAVAVSVVWGAIYHPTMGPVNSFLRSMGISNLPQWTASVTWAMPSVIIMSIWKSCGYYMVLFMAGLQGISKEYYEASEIDGATRWKQFANITLPMLSPTTFFVTVMGIINSFMVFDQIYIMTEGGPGRATNVLVYHIYRESFQNYNLGYASAMAYFLFVIIMVVTLLQFRGQKKWVHY